MRLNFPDNRTKFQEQLLASESSQRHLPAGSQLTSERYLRIEGPYQDSHPVNGQGDVVPRPRLPTRLALVSTIQFAAALQKLKEDLSVDVSDNSQDNNSILLTAGASNLWTGAYETVVPRSKPLSPGELLGCTAPVLQDVDALL